LFGFFFFTIIVSDKILKKIVLIFALLAGILISDDFFAQAGGRRREHRNQRKGRLFGGGGSKGNADKFARNGGRQSILGRIFNSGYKAPAWVMNSKRQHINADRRDSRSLFSRYRTSGRRYREGILAKQNAARARSRVRGNAVFHKRKY
jgi:hypothetical protein